MKIILFFILYAGIVSAQTDWIKWGKADVDYEISSQHQRSHSIDDSSIGSSILSGLQVSYAVLISDVDGDNCPFYPTCSSFFVRSIKETNIFQGTLMFADRFTRDSNLFKRRDHYPVHYSGRLYDPTYNYYLDQNKVKFYSRKKIVE
ncbi:MAG: membrane protein insertion efficiency factor YidD [Chlorobi bacterium]|nr:membrane protein insertion efficiency factor YidD [Chlorobiota bacterium]